MSETGDNINEVSTTAAKRNSSELDVPTEDLAGPPEILKSSTLADNAMSETPGDEVTAETLSVPTQNLSELDSRTNVDVVNIEFTGPLQETVDSSTTTNVATKETAEDEVTAETLSDQVLQNPSEQYPLTCSAVAKIDFIGPQETVDSSNTTSAATMAVAEDQEIGTHSAWIQFPSEQYRLASIDVAIGKFASPLELLDNSTPNIVMRKIKDVIKEVLDSIIQVSQEQDRVATSNDVASDRTECNGNAMLTGLHSSTTNVAEPLMTGVEINRVLALFESIKDSPEPVRRERRSLWCRTKEFVRRIFCCA